VYQHKLQEQVERTETHIESKQCGNCKKKTQTHDTFTKTIVSAHGRVTLHRRYRRCPHCKNRSFPADVTLGLDKDYTDGLKRHATRCCGFWSYRLSAESLEEFCGIHLSYTTLGKIAGHTAEEIAERWASHPDVRHDFQKAKGESEFYADGTFIHIRTLAGLAKWMEVKVGAFAKRERGLSAFPSEWHTRILPEPTVVSAFASIADKEEFLKLCLSERRRLGVGGVSSALGDGAKWIWNVVREVFGNTDECLDIYHGAEHISDCSKILFGASSSQDWFERMRIVLLSEGLVGLERELKLLSGLKKRQRSSVDSLLEYFRGNAGRLNYCERLSGGRAIGSGLIEGACKNLAGRRLKQTGACWRLPQANRIAVISAALYSKQWKYAWKIPKKI